MICPVCFHHCKLSEGDIGLCLARQVRDGVVVPRNYGCVTSLALDPIEKKPLAEFHPGSMILSVGSFGCNLRCPFCQNHGISYDETVVQAARRSDSESHEPWEHWTPKELAAAAEELIPRGNIGLAFTYNEPLVGYEFVRDTARLIRAAGMETVLVTNGTTEPEIEEELLPHISAMNVDLKAFNDHFYDDLICGNRQVVMGFIERAARQCHVEVTTLIIPGENDSETEITELAQWLAGVEQRCFRGIPLHITRFFPRYKMTDKGPTDPGLVRRLGEVAGQYLEHVYLGNL